MNAYRLVVEWWREVEGCGVMWCGVVGDGRVYVLKLRGRAEGRPEDMEVMVLDRLTGNCTRLGGLGLGTVILAISSRKAADESSMGADAASDDDEDDDDEPLPPLPDVGPVEELLDDVDVAGAVPFLDTTTW
jgi:hypothetical protein